MIFIFSGIESIGVPCFDSLILPYSLPPCCDSHQLTAPSWLSSLDPRFDLLSQELQWGFDRRYGSAEDWDKMSIALPFVICSKLVCHHPRMNIKCINIKCIFEFCVSIPWLVCPYLSIKCMNIKCIFELLSTWISQSNFDDGVQSSGIIFLNIFMFRIFSYFYG